MPGHDLENEKEVSQWRGVRLAKADGTEFADTLRLEGGCTSEEVTKELFGVLHHEAVWVAKEAGEERKSQIDRSL